MLEIRVNIVLKGNKITCTKLKFLTQN